MQSVDRVESTDCQVLDRVFGTHPELPSLPEMLPGRPPAGVGEQPQVLGKILGRQNELTCAVESLGILRAGLLCGDCGPLGFTLHYRGFGCPQVAR